MSKQSESAPMRSPLADYLWRRKEDDDLSFGEMSRRALRQGAEISPSRISQIANDATGRLTEDTIKALAFGTGELPEYIAELDDQRYGFVSRDGRGTQSVRDLPQEALLEEVARRMAEERDK